MWPRSRERETDRVVWRWKQPRSALRSEALDRSQVIDLAAARHLHGEDSPPAGAYREDVHWEARLPLIDPDDGAFEGWLTIRRPWGTYLPSELDVLARELLPRGLRDGVATRERERSSDGTTPDARTESTEVRA